MPTRDGPTLPPGEAREAAWRRQTPTGLGRQRGALPGFALRSYGPGSRRAGGEARVVSTATLYRPCRDDPRQIVRSDFLNKIHL